jgi:hypothetical protein
MNLDATVDVGRLLAFALDVAATPGSGGAPADYARLIRRYVEDATFRSLFNGVVEGAGCEVATADITMGVVLRTRADGPWAWPARSADLPWNGSFEEPQQRAARALVVIALIAYVAPSAADLDDVLSEPDTVLTAVGVRELEQFIRDFCEQCESNVSDPTASVEQRPLWWHWLQLPAETPTARRISRGTTTYLVYEVLSFLHSLGWLTEISSSRPAASKQYRPRRRLLYHYRDLLMDDVFRALRTYAENPERSSASEATETEAVTSDATSTGTLDEELD